VCLADFLDTLLWGACLPKASPAAPPQVIYQPFAYTALQAVRAAAEAGQPPSDSAPDPLHQKASTKPMGPKRPPAVLKPPKAKPVFVRKRSSTDAAAIQTTVSPHLACGCLWQLAHT